MGTNFASELKMHKRRLMRTPNVVGVGRGYKTAGGMRTEDEAIVVLVERKLSPSELTNALMVPAKLVGLPTDVVEVGRLRALEAVQPRGSGRMGRIRPAPGGVSIGHPDITAGTLGAIVYDRQTGYPYILSNNHVLANSSTRLTGRPARLTPSLQPGPYDDGRPTLDAIGRLERFIPLKRWDYNLFDAAIARPDNPGDVDPDIMEIGRPIGMADAFLGQRVRKSGRTTGLTSGKVTLLDADVEVEYEAFVLQFTGTIGSDMQSQGGDSGSLVVDDQLNAVGLLFAGSEQVTVCCPIKPISELLGFTFEPRED